MASKNLVSQPPLTAPLVDDKGIISKAWAIWFRDMYKRTAYKGGNAIDENKAELDQELLETNATLGETVDTVNGNTIDINSNETSITENSDNLATHEALTIAHGSNGDVVGNLDLAGEAVVGLVLQMGLINDAVSSIVSVDSPDIAAAPGAYNQAYTDTVKDLANETKADLNTLVTDVNNAITKINAILAENISSGQMNNV